MEKIAVSLTTCRDCRAILVGSGGKNDPFSPQPPAIGGGAGSTRAGGGSAWRPRRRQPGRMGPGGRRRRRGLQPEAAQEAPRSERRLRPGGGRGHGRTRPRERPETVPEARGLRLARGTRAALQRRTAAALGAGRGGPSPPLTGDAEGWHGRGETDAEALPPPPPPSRRGGAAGTSGRRGRGSAEGRRGRGDEDGRCGRGGRRGGGGASIFWRDRRERAGIGRRGEWGGGSGASTR